MRRPIVMTVSASAALLFLISPAAAVNFGLSDGNGHPAVGFILGTTGPAPCGYLSQSVGCSGVLIAPDVFLTSGDCSSAFADGLSTGFIDDVWVILDAVTQVPGDDA